MHTRENPSQGLPKYNVYREKNLFEAPRVQVFRHPDYRNLNG